jgi:N-acetyl sugar amidotransferase
MQRIYQQCTHCILDTNDDPLIKFNDVGVCNYCVNYEKTYIQGRRSEAQLASDLAIELQRIKHSGKGKKYDSIMGLSGGVDSSYLAFKAKEFGLRPLLVHFDNGWNSELAIQNIEGIINKTGFDLYTYVVNWEEFRDLQLAYIKAGVLDWEIPTDHGFVAALFKAARKYKIQYILTGHNHQTEAILPKSMRWSKMDVANIKDIHAKFGNIPLKTFPMLGFFELNYFYNVLKVKRVNLLEFIEYDKAKAKETIQREFGWRDYGGKHYESIFTRFYQGYVLKEKFGFDKRKAHVSNLICSGQMTRDEALAEVAKPAYDPKQLIQDTEYFQKKLGISAIEFDKIMHEKPVPHTQYKSYETGLYKRHIKFMTSIRPITRIIKKMMGKKA